MPRTSRARSGRKSPRTAEDEMGDVNIPASSSFFLFLCPRFFIVGRVCISQASRVFGVRPQYPRVAESLLSYLQVWVLCNEHEREKRSVD